MDLQSLRQSRERTAHPDRNAQFEHINATAAMYLRAKEPVISVDTKKKELVGNHCRIDATANRGHKRDFA